jgi:hypothetical protein
MVSSRTLSVKENSMKKRHSEEQIIRILREAESREVRNPLGLYLFIPILDRTVAFLESLTGVQYANLIAKP